MFHEFADPVYRRRVYLFVGDRRALIDYIEGAYGKSKAKGVAKDCIGLSFQVKSPHPDYPQVESKVYFVWLVAWAGTPREHALLCHECIHVTAKVFDDLGVDWNDEEAVCYYTDAMVEQFLTALKGAP